MGRSKKFLVLALFVVVCISAVSGHANHSHDDNENQDQGEFSSLLDSYSSGMALGVIEVTLGIALVSLAGVHYFRNPVS